MIEFRDRFAGARAGAARAHERGGACAGHQPLRLRVEQVHDGHEDRGAQAGAHRQGLRLRLRRCPARRGALAGQGAHLLLPRRFQQWDPKNQRPELWNLYNAKITKGESVRVFPLSNWTELDVWLYVWVENIPGGAAVLRQARPVVEREGTLIMVDDDRMRLEPGEKPQMRTVRFRTLGCYPLTGAVESTPPRCPRSSARCCSTSSRAPGPPHRLRRGGLDGGQEARGVLLVKRSPGHDKVVGLSAADAHPRRRRGLSSTSTSARSSCASWRWARSTMASRR
jgi:3'-phosphoadenosine 5'-phosphosulfate sulfotransferase (PAPS reductase)/FAD synthetase